MDVLRIGVLGTARITAKALLGPTASVPHVTVAAVAARSNEADIRYSYDLGGGALMDGGCYAIDCLRLLGPGEPEVTAALPGLLPRGE